MQEAILHGNIDKACSDGRSAGLSLAALVIGGTVVHVRMTDRGMSIYKGHTALHSATFFRSALLDVASHVMGCFCHHSLIARIKAYS